MVGYCTPVMSVTSPAALNRHGRTLTLSAVSFVLLACGKGTEAPSRSTSDPGETASVAKSAATVSAAPSSPVAVPATKWVKGPGKLPLDYPAAATTAQAGDFAFAPPPRWIEEAFENGVEHQPFVFFAGEVLETGQRESRLKTESGAQWVVPNTALVVIPKKATDVEVGDVVVTEWDASNTLQRALVVAVEEGDGGAPTVRARYLDLLWDEPSGDARRIASLPEGTYLPLKPGDVGSTQACLVAGVARRFVVIHAREESYLGLGYAGRLAVLARESCGALPLKPKVEVGQEVHVPVLGVFQPAKVTRIDAAAGRVWVRYEAQGKLKEDAVGYCNVALEVPSAP